MKKIALKPPAYFFGCLVYIGVVHFTMPMFRVVDLPWNFFGLVILVFSSWMVIKTHYSFKAHKTPEDFSGPKCVVKDGLHKYGRNPMYVGLVLFLLGLALLTGNVLALLSPLFMFMVLHFMFIPFEEENMKILFGEEYLEYKRSVRKWI